jgi:RNA polymerase sigma-70 factor (ECF subfamily)
MSANAEMTRELLERARQGSETALNDLFGRVAGRLLALIRLRLGQSLRSRLESRDILQATLLKAFLGLDRLKEEDSATLMAWLARIAENEIRDQADYHGRQRRDAARETPLVDVRSRRLVQQIRSQTSRLALDEEMRRLEQALEAVAPHYREIIILRKYEELEFAAIGERLGKSADACRMLYARAMAAVTLQLGETP